MERFQNVLRIIAVCVLVVVAVELAGIWIQLGHIRSEQVKNGLYGAASPARVGAWSRFFNRRLNVRDATVAEKVTVPAAFAGTAMVEDGRYLK